MRVWVHGAVLAGLMLSGALNAAEEDGDEGLRLPNWEQEEVSIFPLGGSLLPQPSGGPQGEGGPDDMRMFIPKSEGKQGQADAKGPGAEEQLTQVDADFFERSEGLTDGGFVLDPGGNLAEQEREELGRLLASQAQGARITAHFLILGAKQQLSQNVDISKVGGMNLMGGLGCMVVYPVGEPWRVRLFMSRRVTEVVKQDYLRNLARACIQDALKSPDAEEQLKRFAIQLAIRLTWLEREHELPESPEVAEAGGVVIPATASIPLAKAAEASDVTEVGMLAPADEVMPFWQVWWKKLKPWVWGTMAGLVALMLLWKGARWLGRRLVRRKSVAVWILPEPHVKPRLGGKHCGGGGAAVKY